MHADAVVVDNREAEACQRVEITRGADAVHLAEELSLRLFVLALAFVLVGSALSAWPEIVGTYSTGGLLTIPLALGGVAFALAGLARPRRLYDWLRYSPTRQFAPALAAIAAMLVNGRQSPSWWLALALLVLVASVSSMRLSLVAASLAAAAFLGGTVMRGGGLITAGDVGMLAGTVGLIAYTLVGASVAETLGRFVLMLHRLEHQVASPSPPAPLRVANLAAQPTGTTDVTHKTSTTPRTASQGAARRLPHRHDAGGTSRLTRRQLEVAFLVRDGLKQPEIAIALSISPRQVERLLSQARERAGAATTGHLVAMLVTDGLVPPITPPDTDDGQAASVERPIDP